MSDCMLFANKNKNNKWYQQKQTHSHNHTCIWTKKKPLFWRSKADMICSIIDK